MVTEQMTIWFFCGFKEQTLSRTGIRKLSPGSRIVLNLPILSTNQASCWGTNITPMFTGVPLPLCLWGRRRRGFEGSVEDARRGRLPCVLLASNRRPKTAPLCKDIAISPVNESGYQIRQGRTSVWKFCEIGRMFQQLTHYICTTTKFHNMFVFL